MCFVMDDAMNRKSKLGHKTMSKGSTTSPFQRLNPPSKPSPPTSNTPGPSVRTFTGSDGTRIVVVDTQRLNRATDKAKGELKPK